MDSGEITEFVPPRVADHGLLRRIGQGASGEVWLGRGITGAWRAVKVVRRDRFEHERTYEREFGGLRRYEPVSRGHEGCVDILQVGRDEAGGFFYYVMELADDAEGGMPGVADPATYQPLTLAEALRRRGRLPIGEAAKLGAMVAEALGYLHGHGLVHRDIKPSNIVFVGGRPKLADIGLVTRFGEARSFVGTEGFIPPEGPGTPRADLYSLGMVLYEMSTGRSRFEFPDLPLELPADEAQAFAEWNEILLRACAADARARHVGAEELRGELLLVDAGRSVRRLRRNERLMGAWRRIGVLALLVLLAGAILLGVERQRTASARALAAVEMQLRRAIEEREARARQNLYAADMNLAQQAIDSGNYGRAEALLAGHEAGDRGEEVPRGFEWFHYRHRVRGDSVGVLTGHEQVVSSLALGSRDDLVYSASFDTTVREWSIPSGRELRRWSMPGSLFMAMALEPRGGRLAFEGGNRAFSSVLDLETGHWTTNVGSASPSIVWAPGGNRLVRGAGMLLFETNGSVEITDTGFRVERVLERVGGRAAFSPDGTLLATGPCGHAVCLWSWPALDRVGLLEGAGVVMSMAFSPDGTHLATAARDGTLALWDVVKRRRQAQVLAHDGTVVWSLGWSPDGSRLVTGGNDQTVRTWEAASLRERHVYRGHGSEVWAVLWTRDGRRLVSAGKDASLRLWEAEPRPGPGAVAGVARAPVFSTDDRRVAVVLAGRLAVVREVESGSEVWRHGGVLEVGGFREEDGTLAVLTEGGTVEWWQPWAGGVRVESRTSGSPEGAQERRLLAGAGRWLVHGGRDGRVCLEEVGLGRGVEVLEGHEGMVLALAVSLDGRWLLTGGMDRTARLWDLSERRLSREFSGHKMGVGSVAFSPDGSRVATGSWDDTVGIWDRETGRRVAWLDGHESGVQAVAFAPGGRTLSAMTGAGTLKFWCLGAEREAGLLRVGRGTRLGHLVFGGRGEWLALVGQDEVMNLVAAPRDSAGSW